MHICLSIPELVDNIAEHVSSPPDLSRLSRTCRAFRAICLPHLVREISIPLRHAQAVRIFAAKVPFFKCHKLEILGKLRYDPPRWCSGLSSIELDEGEIEGEDAVTCRLYLKWCGELARLLRAISRGACLRHFMMATAPVPAYLPRGVWSALSLSSETLETMHLMCWEECVNTTGEGFYNHEEYMAPDHYVPKPFPALRSLVVTATTFGNDDRYWDAGWIQGILENAQHLGYFSLIYPHDVHADMELPYSYPTLMGFECHEQSPVDCTALVQNNPQLERLRLAQHGTEVDLEYGSFPSLKALWDGVSYLCSSPSNQSLASQLLHLRLRASDLEGMTFWPWSTFHVRCLELTMWQSEMDDVLHSLAVICPSLLEMQEIGFFMWKGEYFAEDSQVTQALARVLEAVRGAPQLTALHIECWDDCLRAYDRLNLGHAFPPRLRYLLWGFERERSFYHVYVMNDAAIAVRASERSLRVRATRSDWTGESVYDHLEDTPSF